jgi:hypothetical protein
MQKAQIVELAEAMNEYDQLKNKDKSVEDITQERILKVSSKVKYALIKNWNGLKAASEAIQEILNDQFKTIGGTLNADGSGHWSDPSVPDELLIKHKNDKAKLVQEMKKIRLDNAEKSEKYSQFRKALLQEDAGEDIKKLMAIQPTEQDIECLPASLIAWYMDNDLLVEPVWPESTSLEDKKEA